jgi:hypothetical protein
MAGNQSADVARGAIREDGVLAVESIARPNIRKPAKMSEWMKDLEKLLDGELQISET